MTSRRRPFFQACAVAGCGGDPNQHRAQNGYCYRHFRRWQRHGDPLAGGTAQGAPEQFYRNVVLNHEGDECLVWPYAKIGRGYGQMSVGSGKRDYVHRRLCVEVHGPAPTPDHEVAHSCGRGHEACVSKHHLSWKTRAANHHDKVQHGTHSRGERSATCKLTEAQVREILSLRGVISQKRLAVRFGVTFQLISLIHRRRCWAWLDVGEAA